MAVTYRQRKLGGEWWSVVVVQVTVVVHKSGEVCGAAVVTVGGVTMGALAAVAQLSHVGGGSACETALFFFFRFFDSV